VINFVARSNVPEIFLSTNDLETQSLIDVAKEYWNLDVIDEYFRKYKFGVNFIEVSTVELYVTFIYNRLVKVSSNVRKI